MIKYILIAVCVCFSMLGLAEFLHGVKTKLIASGKKGTTYAVVFLSDGNPEDQIALPQSGAYGSERAMPTV